MACADAVRQRSGLSGFSIQWQNPQPALPARLRPSAVKSPTPWFRALESHLKASLSEKTAAFVDFLSQDFKDLDNDYYWQFERLLGSGTFGVVAHYSARDRQGRAVDDIVIKAAIHQHEEQNNGRPEIPLEAAIMAQTNDLQTDTMLFLRQFKTGDFIAEVPTNLYYLEYCNFGSLQALKQHYKAFKKPFPEAFLWYLLDSFVKACVAMERGPFRNHDSSVKVQGRNYRWGDILPDAYLVHGDIKPDNIFLTMLDDIGTGHKSRRFPSIRIGDFGCARVLHEELELSRRFRQGRGTLEYLAPELRLAFLPHQLEEKAHRHAPKRLEWRMRRLARKAGSKFASTFAPDTATSDTNLWPFMAIIWEFMTLREIGELSDLVEERKYRGPLGIGKTRDTMLDGNIMHPIAPNAPPYSPELVVLVKNGLQFVPEKRARLAEVETAVERGLRRSLANGMPRIDFRGATGGYGYFPEVGELEYEPDYNWWRRYKEGLLWRNENFDPGFPPELDDELMLPLTNHGGEINQLWKDRVDESRLQWANHAQTQRSSLQPTHIQAARKTQWRGTMGTKRKADDFEPTTPQSPKRRQPPPRRPVRGTSGKIPLFHEAHPRARQDSARVVITNSAEEETILDKYRSRAPPSRAPPRAQAVYQAYQAYNPNVASKNTAPAPPIRPTTTATVKIPPTQHSHLLPSPKRLSDFNPDFSNLASFAAGAPSPHRPNKSKRFKVQVVKLEPEHQNPSVFRPAHHNRRKRERAVEKSSRGGMEVHTPLARATRQAIWAERYVAERERRGRAAAVAQQGGDYEYDYDQVDSTDVD